MEAETRVRFSHPDLLSANEREQTKVRRRESNQGGHAQRSEHVRPGFDSRTRTFYTSRLPRVVRLWLEHGVRVTTRVTFPVDTGRPRNGCSAGHVGCDGTRERTREWTVAFAAPVSPITPVRPRVSTFAGVMIVLHVAMSASPSSFGDRRKRRPMASLPGVDAVGRGAPVGVRVPRQSAASTRWDDVVEPVFWMTSNAVMRSVREMRPTRSPPSTTSSRPTPSCCMVWRASMASASGSMV